MPGWNWGGGRLPDKHNCRNFYTKTSPPATPLSRRVRPDRSRIAPGRAVRKIRKYPPFAALNGSVGFWRAQLPKHWNIFPFLSPAWSQWSLWECKRQKQNPPAWAGLWRRIVSGAVGVSVRLAASVGNGATNLGQIGCDYPDPLHRLEPSLLSHAPDLSYQPSKVWF